jgi:hypothetical protein
MVCVGLIAASTGSAQGLDPGPPGPYVVDARGVVGGLPNALPLLPATSDVVSPSRGLGAEVGAHVYPASLGPARLGVGASVLRVSGGASPLDTNSPIDTRMTLVAPQVSLNFGSDQGWSYVSGGYGWGQIRASFMAPGLGTEADTGWGPMLNYGAGARWFLNRHLAFGFDLRAYQFQARLLQAGRTVLTRTTVVTASIGVSLR